MRSRPWSKWGALGVLVGLLMAVLVPTGANAAALSTENVTAARVMPAAVPSEFGEVTDQPWSGPALDVECNKAMSIVSCVPNDTKDVKDRACFQTVIADGQEMIVCTTTDENQDELQSAGGEKLEYKWGCDQTWDACAVMERMAFNLALDSLNTMMMVSEAIRFNTDSLLWTTALEEWSFWAWAVWVIMIGAFIFSLTVAALQGRKDDLVAALWRGFIAVPAVSFTLWLFGQVINAIDDLAWYVLDQGDRNFFEKLTDAYWAGGEVFPGTGLLMNGLLLCAMLGILFVFLARNFALAALAMIGPVAWMLFPAGGVGKAWVIRYVSAVGTLLLAGPLTMALFSWILNGLGSVSTLWDPRAWPFVIALFFVAFAPFAVFSLFSFVGGVAADQIASRGGAAAARGAKNTATRLLRGQGGGAPRPRVGMGPATNSQGKRGSSGPGGTGTSTGTGTGAPTRTPATNPARSDVRPPSTPGREGRQTASVGAAAVPSTPAPAGSRAGGQSSGAGQSPRTRADARAARQSGGTPVQSASGSGSAPTRRAGVSPQRVAQQRRLAAREGNGSAAGAAMGAAGRQQASRSLSGGRAPAPRVAGTGSAARGATAPKANDLGPAAPRPVGTNRDGKPLGRPAVRTHRPSRPHGQK